MKLVNKVTEIKYNEYEMDEKETKWCCDSLKEWCAKGFIFLDRYKGNIYIHVSKYQHEGSRNYELKFCPFCGEKVE